MSAPQWSPIDDETAFHLLDLVADVEHPSVDHEWQAWLAAVRTVAAPDGRVDPNALTLAVRGVVAPKRCGAFVHRALRSGLLAWRGDYVTSTDRVGGNAGRPIRCYYLTELTHPTVCAPSCGPGLCEGCVEDDVDELGAMR